MNIRIVYAGEPNPLDVSADEIFSKLMGRNPESDPTGQSKVSRRKMTVDRLVDDYKTVAQKAGRLSDHPDSVTAEERASILDEINRIGEEAKALSRELVGLALSADDIQDMDEFSQLETTARRIRREVLMLSKAPILQGEPEEDEEKGEFEVDDSDLSAYGKQVAELCEDNNRLSDLMNKVRELGELPSPAEAMMMDILLTELLQKEQYLYNTLREMGEGVDPGAAAMINSMLRPMRGVWKNASRMRSDLRDMVDMPQDFVALYRRYGDLCVAVRYLKEDRPDKLNGTTAEDVIGYANGQAKRARYLASSPLFRMDKDEVMIMNRVAKKFGELAEAAKQFLDKPAETDVSDSKQKLSAYLSAMLDEMERG